MNRKYTYNEDFFKEPNVINSYWAGFIAADGCINDKQQGQKILQIKLKYTDSVILEHFKKAINYTGPILSGVDKYYGAALLKYGHKEFKTAYLRISSFNKSAQDLQDNFLIGPRKSLTLKFPDHLSAECKKAFIVGYSDGDGHISFNKRFDRVTKINLLWQLAGTLEFLTSVKNFLNVGTIYKKGRIYAYQIHSKKIFLALPDLLNIAAVPYLERKWNKIEEYRQLVESATA